MFSSDSLSQCIAALNAIYVDQSAISNPTLFAEANAFLGRLQARAVIWEIADKILNTPNLPTSHYFYAANALYSRLLGKYQDLHSAEIRNSFRNSLFQATESFIGKPGEKAVLSRLTMCLSVVTLHMIGNSEWSTALHDVTTKYGRPESSLFLLDLLTMVPESLLSHKMELSTESRDIIFKVFSLFVPTLLDILYSFISSTNEVILQKNVLTCLAAWARCEYLPMNKFFSHKLCAAAFEGLANPALVEASSKVFSAVFSGSEHLITGLCRGSDYVSLSLHSLHFHNRNRSNSQSLGYDDSMQNLDEDDEYCSIYDNDEYREVDDEIGFMQRGRLDFDMEADTDMKSSHNRHLATNNSTNDDSSEDYRSRSRQKGLQVKVMLAHVVLRARLHLMRLFRVRIGDRDATSARAIATLLMRMSSLCVNFLLCPPDLTLVPSPASVGISEFAIPSLPSDANDSLITTDPASRPSSSYTFNEVWLSSIDIMVELLSPSLPSGVAVFDPENYTNMYPGPNGVPIEFDPRALVSLTYSYWYSLLAKIKEIDRRILAMASNSGQDLAAARTEYLLLSRNQQQQQQQHQQQQQRQQQQQHQQLDQQQNLSIQATHAGDDLARAQTRYQTVCSIYFLLNQTLLGSIVSRLPRILESLLFSLRLPRNFVDLNEEFSDALKQHRYGTADVLIDLAVLFRGATLELFVSNAKQAYGAYVAELEAAEIHVRAQFQAQHQLAVAEVAELAAITASGRVTSILHCNESDNEIESAIANAALRAVSWQPLEAAYYALRMTASELGVSRDSEVQMDEIDSRQTVLVEGAAASGLANREGLDPAAVLGFNGMIGTPNEKALTGVNVGAFRMVNPSVIVEASQRHLLDVVQSILRLSCGGQLLYTATLLLGRFSAAIAERMDLIPTFLWHISLALRNPEVSAAASTALRSLCFECPRALCTAYFETVVGIYTTARGCVETRTLLEVVEGLSFMLADLRSPDMEAEFVRFVRPIITRARSLLHSNGVNVIIGAPIQSTDVTTVTTLSALASNGTNSTLPATTFAEVCLDMQVLSKMLQEFVNGHSGQLAFVAQFILQINPLLETLASTFCSSAAMVEHVCRVWRTVLTTTGPLAAPLIPSLCTSICALFKKTPQSGYLYLANFIVRTFHHDIVMALPTVGGTKDLGFGHEEGIPGVAIQNSIYSMFNFFSMLSESFLEYPERLEANPDLAEDYLMLVAETARRWPSIVYTPGPILQNIVRLATERIAWVIHPDVFYSGITLLARLYEDALSRISIDLHNALVPVTQDTLGALFHSILGARASRDSVAICKALGPMLRFLTEAQVPIKGAEQVPGAANLRPSQLIMRLLIGDRDNGPFSHVPDRLLYNVEDIASLSSSRQKALLGQFIRMARNEKTE